MATNFNYEVDYDEIMQHLAHNDNIDLLVTKANKFDSGNYMIFSNDIHFEMIDSDGTKYYYTNGILKKINYMGQTIIFTSWFEKLYK